MSKALIRSPSTVEPPSGDPDAQRPPPRRRVTLSGGVAAAMGAIVAVAVLWPAWSQMGTYAFDNAHDIGAQHDGAVLEATQVNELIAYVRGHGGGRVYAGMPSNWGEYFGVGAVPVFKYLESQDIDEVGYTLRTASLMTDPEYFFDQNDPGDFALFGVHYLILRAGMTLPVAAHVVLSAGPYRLWVLPQVGYVRLVDLVGVEQADRTNVGLKSIRYLRSRLPASGRYLAVAYEGAPAAALTTTDANDLTGSAGTVSYQDDRLAEGEVDATVVASRRCAVVLSASFDPGWTVRVDGRPAHTEMVAPALVAVTVPAGHHDVVFTYTGFGSYTELWAASIVALAAVAWWSLSSMPLRRRRPVTPPGPDAEDVHT